jgi:hypothetical protein
MATRSAWIHVGLTPPQTAMQPQDLFDEGTLR